MPTQALTASAARAVAAKILREYQQWLAADGPIVDWQGTDYKVISKSLDETIRKGCDEITDAAECAEDAREVVMAIDALTKAHIRWQNKAAAETGRPDGGDDIAKAMETLSTVAAPRARPAPPQSVTVLAKDLHVPYSQIAVIYGWRDSNGEPDITKVVEEINKPGTHYDPKKWIHPSIALELAEINQRWARHVRPNRKLSQPEEAPAQPPPIEEYLRQGAPVEQIARLFRLSEEEVRERAAIEGVELGSRYIKPVNHHVAMAEAAAAS